MMKAIIKESFECPRCNFDYHRGEIIEVESSPAGIGATHDCLYCSNNIELNLVDDRFVEL